MLNFIKASFALLFIVINSIIISITLVLLKLIWYVSGNTGLYNKITKLLYFIWIRFNQLILLDFLGLEIEFLGSDEIPDDDWHILLSNHQGFMDILIIQIFCLRHKLNNKFFMKQSLIYLPFIGLGCWGLDFVFIKRFSRKTVKRQPEKVQHLHRYIECKCKSYLSTPNTVINFVEGTRANTDKLKQSPYNNLLTPQPMGLSLILSAMPEVKSMIDLTLNYSITEPSLLKLLYHKQVKIICHHRTIDICQGVSGDYRSDKLFRRRFNAWLKNIWQEKDLMLSKMKS